MVTRESTSLRLTEIFRELFNAPDLVLSDTMTAADIDGWDSFNHVNLVMMVEEEFNLRFNTSEIASLANVGNFISLITSKID